MPDRPLAPTMRWSRRGRGARAPSSATTTSATTSSTTPRSATPSTTTLVRELRGLEEQYPALDHARLARRSRSAAAASATFAPVEHRVPMMSLDNAFDEDELRAWGARVERGLGRRRRRASCASSRSTAWPSRCATRAAASCRPPPAATVGSARTSPPTSPPSPRCPSGSEGRRPVLEVRGEVYMPVTRLRGAQPAPGRGRPEGVRQPAQLGRRQPAPEGPAHHRQPRAVDVVLPARRRRWAARRSRSHHATLEFLARPRPPGEPRDPPGRVASTRCTATPRAGRSTATTSTTRSTARW